jgi:formylglycine-generating enzyme required for sulfatase activity
LYQNGQYAEAAGKYEAALEQKPDDEYAKIRKQNCEEKIDEREKLFAKYKSEGEAFFQRGEYANAKVRFSDALIQKPEDQYIIDKINACDQRIAKEEVVAKRARSFAQYRDAGDALFNQGEYARAKNQYERAHSYKSDDSYVVNRIQECNDRLAARAAESSKQETVPADMVLIRGGSFMMGSNDFKNEQPVHQVEVVDFYLDKYEVTVERYAQFLQANPAQRAPDHWSKQLQHSNHPVVYVSWKDAITYCAWLSKLRGKRVRLPSEAEWEYAARGGLVGKKYPLGNEISHEQANYYGRAGKDQWDGPAPVGRFPANGFSLYDMAGNVWEWCSSLYKPYPYQRDDGRENLSASGSRVLHGGSWSINPNNLRCANRFTYPPLYRDNNVGFRCAQDVR